MFRYATFSLLGILVGMAIFSFGYYTSLVGNKSALRAPAQLNIDDVKENVILDPVPTAATPETLGTSNVPTAGALQTTVPNSDLISLTRAELEAITAAATKRQAETLATEIVESTPPPKEEPEVIDGWANSAFLPEEYQGPDIQINDIPETTEEIVR